MGKTERAFKEYKALNKVYVTGIIISILITVNLKVTNIDRGYSWLLLGLIVITINVFLFIFYEFLCERISETYILQFILGLLFSIYLVVTSLWLIIAVSLIFNI